MEYQTLFIILHLIITVLLIGAVLIQRSEGGALGIGGGGGGVMSSRGAATALQKATWGLAIAFFTTSLALAIVGADTSGVDTTTPTPTTTPTKAPASAPDGLAPPAPADGPLAPAAPGEAPFSLDKLKKPEAAAKPADAAKPAAAKPTAAKPEATKPAEPAAAKPAKEGAAE
ncbi:MAG: preprotein translocase subunit SecG [Neomegalonema sp.]|nr:preprotein translocase subunit SecG [Neomegalonema sp.]